MVVAEEICRSLIKSINLHLTSLPCRSSWYLFLNHTISATTIVIKVILDKNYKDLDFFLII